MPESSRAAPGTSCSITTLRATKKRCVPSVRDALAVTVVAPSRRGGDRVMTRRGARARADADRHKALLDATVRVLAADDLSAAVGALADEAAALTSSTSARCCTVVAEGSWWGVEARDQRRRPIDPLAAARLAALGAEDGDVVAVARDADGDIAVVLAVADGDPDAPEILDDLLRRCAPALARLRAVDELRAALRQKEDLVAAVSHELRTPLAVVLGSLQTLRRLGNRVPEDARDELLATAEGGGNRVLRLLEDLLMTASGEHGALRAMSEVVDPAELLRSVADEVRAAGGPTCRIDCDADLPIVVTDQDKLRRIVTNLVENAGKYAPGSIVELGVRTEGDELVVTVADHGPGIAPADRTRVFQPFVRLDRSAERRRGGTGLGLHLCRTMTDVLGGRLSLDDRPDGASGAHFTLHLPIVVPAREAALGAVGGHP
jgi:signal transduction histidine kinase